MICDTTDQAYQSIVTKCSILPRYVENRAAKPKDPRQQSTKVEKIDSLNHEVSKTLKIIENGSLSTILGASEQHHKNQANH